MTTPLNSAPSPQEVAAIPAVSLREYIATEIAALARLADERDRLYMTKFQESKDAVKDALAAQEKAVAAAFLASEKAIVKAEDAQKDYNVRSNEFRQTLDDQNKIQMPRTEVMTLLSAVNQKFEAAQKQIDEQTALDLGMKEKAEESVAGGRDLSDHQYLDRMYRSNKIELKAPHGYPFL